MVGFYKRKFLIIFLFLFSCADKNDKYKVATNLPLPALISSSLAGTNTVYFILKQTHEPLFRKDDGENYSSKILKKWERNLTNTAFVFCPDTSKEFYKKRRFDEDFFKTYISSVTLKFDKNFRLSQNKDCFNIVFNKPQPKYLDFLTFYENAPSIVRNENLEDGLGEFYVSDMNTKEMRLLRKKKQKRGYNEIIIKRYDLDEKIPLDMTDYNFINTEDIPMEIRKKYKAVPTFTLKTASIIINNPDLKLRKAVYNNINPMEFMKTFFYNKKFDCIEIQNFLPVGFKYARPGKIKQKKIKSDFSGELKFLNYFYSINEKPMQKFWEDFYLKSGIKVKIVNADISKIKGNPFDFLRKFDIFLISSEATRNDINAFLEIFGDTPMNPYSFKIKELAKIYDEIKKESDKEREEALVNKALSIIEKEYIILPVCQMVKTVYYPPDIKNINVGRDFFQYPEIGEFRW